MLRRVSVLSAVALCAPAVALAQSISDLERSSGACVSCAMDGWSVSAPSPEIITGNGAWPGGTYTVSDVAGGPVEGSSIQMMLSGGSTREAISTTRPSRTSAPAHTVA